MAKYVMPLAEISAELVQEFGGKGANLGELIQAGFNVPGGFCVKTDAYYYLIESNNLSGPISEIVKVLDYDDLAKLEEKTGLIRPLIIEAQIPKKLEQQIADNYRALQTPSGEDALVAVRSSVAVKGTSISSFPGMMETYHYLSGQDQVLHNIKRCWASIWTARAAFARHQRQVDHSLALIAPIVQEMIDAEVAGIMFTMNPITSSNDEIMIQSNWGLGESVVSGKTMNDLYILDKATLSTKQSTIPHKAEMIVHDREKGTGSKQVPVPEEKADQPTLTDEMLQELTTAGLQIEAHFGVPQDIEWAYWGGQLFILQARRSR